MSQQYQHAFVANCPNCGRSTSTFHPTVAFVCEECLPSWQRRQPEESAAPPEENYIGLGEAQVTEVDRAIVDKSKLSYRRKRWITRFTERQRQTRVWISFKEIAGCIDKELWAPPNDTEVARYTDLYGCLSAARFEDTGCYVRGSAGGVLLMNPLTPFRTMTSERFGQLLYVSARSLVSNWLRFCWVHRDLARAWHQYGCIQLPPGLLALAETAGAATLAQGVLSAEAARVALPKKAPTPDIHNAIAAVFSYARAQEMKPPNIKETITSVRKELLRHEFVATYQRIETCANEPQHRRLRGEIGKTIRGRLRAFSYPEN